jgi:streptogramin lyase
MRIVFRILFSTVYMLCVGFCFTSNVSSSAMLVDLDNGARFDITEALQKLTGIDDITGVTAITAIPGHSADTWLIVAGENKFEFLDAGTLQPLFSIPETALRELFGLPEGSGRISALKLETSPVDTFLYFDNATGDCYGIDLGTGVFGLYTDLDFTAPFYRGFSYTAPHDIGLILQDDSGHWWYETLPERDRISLDMESLFGIHPTHFTEFSFDAFGMMIPFVIAVSDGSAPGTPTPTPQPGTPTPTPTPGESPEYNVVIAMGLGETLWRVDADNYATEPDAALTGQAPSRVVLHNNELFVINSLSHSITVYDPVSLSLKRELSTGIGTSPFDMAFADDTSFYVTQFNANRVIRLNAFTGQTLAEIPMPELPSDPGKTTAPRPSGITVIGNHALVACANLDTSFFPGGPGYTVVIDIQSDHVVDYFESNGRNTARIVHSNSNPDHIWIVNAGDYSSGQGFHLNGTVSVFTWPGLNPVHTIQTNDAPMDLVFGPQRAWFASAADEHIGRIDTATFSVLPPVTLPNAGHGMNMVSGLALGPDERLWALSFNTDKAFVLNTAQDDTIIRDISVGWGPDALAIVER